MVVLVVVVLVVGQAGLPGVQQAVEIVFPSTKHVSLGNWQSHPEPLQLLAISFQVPPVQRQVQDEHEVVVVVVVVEVGWPHGVSASSQLLPPS